QCANRTIGGRMGWRLPSVHELASLIDPTQSNSNPPRRNLLLPLGHPFTNIMPEPYWSASAFSGTPDSAWAIFFSRLYEISGNGQVYTSGTPAEHALYVWCVRGGMTADAY
ncbi:MAG: DUF1566 domain-containing protein, partial [Nitrospira sp.]|nr:DUF1566 domain-containing protein [Nitrospira sp.]